MSDIPSESERIANNQAPYFNEFIHKVDKGRRGENSWVPYPFKKMRQRLGMKQSLYHLVGGEPGSGKSAFVDLVYVLHAYQWWKQVGQDRGMDLEIYLRSMERSREYRVAKWVAWKLFQDHGILFAPKQLLSWGPGESPVTDQLYDKIQETRDFFDRLQDECLTIIDGPTNPTGIWEHQKEIAKRNGTISKPNDVEVEYDPYNEDKMVVYILDHIGAVRSERGYSKKKKLDKTSEYMQESRDKFGFMNVAVNQFNRSLGDSLRRKGTVEPEKQDFKGSGNMYEDADAAVALFNPHEYHMDTNLGYEIGKFVTTEGFNRYRSAYILKNTYGADNVGFGLNFIGEVGHYRKLPPPGEMSPRLYGLFRTLKKDLSEEHAEITGGGDIGESVSISSNDASIGDS
jgi:hypothetical protein